MIELFQVGLVDSVDSVGSCSIRLGLTRWMGVYDGGIGCDYDYDCDCDDGSCRQPEMKGEGYLTGPRERKIFLLNNIQNSTSAPHHLIFPWSYFGAKPWSSTLYVNVS